MQPGLLCGFDVFLRLVVVLSYCFIMVFCAIVKYYAFYGFK